MHNVEFQYTCIILFCINRNIQSACLLALFEMFTW